MELRASSKCSAVANACLVAGQYSAVKITQVVDEAATEVVLSGTAGGEVKGNEAVLRCVGKDKGVAVVKVLACGFRGSSKQQRRGEEYSFNRVPLVFGTTPNQMPHTHKSRTTQR